jgi:XRE family transcriptional regulator, master regulator for biofilm formation
MEGPSELGRRLKALRIRAGLSQTRLAKLSGVQRPTISFLESGSQSSTSVGNLVKLSRVLGIPVDVLIHGDILEESEDEPPQTCTRVEAWGVPQRG